MTTICEKRHLVTLQDRTINDIQIKEKEGYHLQGKESIHKHDRVLEIYTRLMGGEIIKKQELAEEYSVSPRSIQRDIDSIRDYLANRVTKGERETNIIYDYIAGGFRAVSPRSVTLTNAELFTAAKILLESRSLAKDEMERIISELIEAGLPISERKKMSELLRNELFHYVEPRHGKPLVDQIWELGGAVYRHQLTELEYQKSSGEITKATVKPVGIMSSEYYFYLLAYIGDKDKKYPGYPTVYRIDRIKSYRIREDIFRIPYRDRFEEGEFRKRIPFMYTGKLHTARFIYKGSDIDAVLDRLPTAVAKEQKDGSYLVTVEVFGEKGLNMWLKGQNISY